MSGGDQFLFMRIMYVANILVAGWISFISLFYPKTAEFTVFTNAFEYSEAFRLVGALWGAIFILSLIGIFYPKEMSLVLFFQLIYKSTWLLVAALPALMNSNPYPKPMALCFLFWVIILPFVIPWKSIF